MSISISHAKEKIREIYQLVDRKSIYCGKLLNWFENFAWHYGIGINDNLIFDTAGLGIFNKADKDIRIVPDVQKFTPDETIERLCYAIICFHQWDYGLLGWNCEHLARLVATNCAISYEVKKAIFPIPQLNHDGYHPDAARILSDFIYKNPCMVTDLIFTPDMANY